jgi:hypothetical protein
MTINNRAPRDRQMSLVFALVHLCANSDKYVSNCPDKSLQVSLASELSREAPPSLKHSAFCSEFKEKRQRRARIIPVPRRDTVADDRNRSANWRRATRELRLETKISVRMENLQAEVLPSYLRAGKSHAKVLPTQRQSLSIKLESRCHQHSVRVAVHRNILERI